MSESGRLEALRQELARADAQVCLCAAGEGPEDALRLAVPGTALDLCCPAGTPGGTARLQLACALAERVLRRSTPANSPKELARRLLTGEDLPDADVLRRAGVAENLPRRVLLLQPARPAGLRTLQEMLPTRGQDLVTAADSRTVALLRDESGGVDPEETLQYAQAVQETYLEETGDPLMVGVGDRADTVWALARSADHARGALTLARDSGAAAGVWLWERMVLQRLLSELPAEKRRAYRQLLFTRENERLFTPEMLETIGTFLREDLSLTNAARQLFIHRNTLIYRLDKVQRQTGLDLRRFEDAATFSVLLALGGPAPENQPSAGGNQ